MLVELGLVEQRYQAVLEVLNDGASVTDVARRHGVARQTVHEWLRRYAAEGLGGLADRSSKPLSCPHQMAPELEARIVEMRRAHPGWGPRTILFWLDRDGCGAVAGAHVGGAVPDPSRAGHPAGPEAEAVGLQAVGTVAGRWSCGRWTSSAGSASSTGREAKIVSGIDDHSPVRGVGPGGGPGDGAAGVRRARRWRWRRMGCPTQILTDNGKVFTARFGPGPGPVLFDRICTDNGISHLLTAPRSPTTTGKVERWHKTLRREFLDGKVFASIDDAQAQLDAWVRHYNHERPHQSIGRVPPIERFQLAEPREQAGQAARRDDHGVGAGDDAAGQREGHDRVRHRHLQGRRVAGRPDRRGGLRGRAGADPPPRRARRHPRPPAPARQADRRRRSAAAGRGRHDRRRRRRR